jgi:hypothetical protein
MKDEVYRVTESGTPDDRIGGWNNATKLFNTIQGARQARNGRVQHQAANKLCRERAGKDQIEYPAVKIQKSALVWEDVE